MVAEACFSTTNAITMTVSLCPNGTAKQIGSGAAAPCPSKCDHGTHVAGDAAGKGIYTGGPGYNGVAPDAGIIAVQVFSGLTNDGTSGGVYSVMAFDSDVISGLNWVYTQRSSFHIAAVNMSLGNSSLAATTACDATNPAMKTAIDVLRAADISTVIAAGNDSFSNAIAYPGCISSAISVGAVDNTDAVAYFSNRDPLLTFWAPGVNVLSSIPPSKYTSESGTSMAAPMVAGALAVLRSKNPGASEDMLICVLQNTGKSIVDAFSGTTKPRIQLDAALSALPAPGDPQTCTPPPTATPATTATATATPTGTSTATATETPALPTATPSNTGTTTATRIGTATPALSTSTPVPSDGGTGGTGSGAATPELGSGGLLAIGLLPLALALGALRRRTRRRQHGPA